MAKHLNFICEAKIDLGREADEAKGSIEATLTTWGAREGVDGRKFNYQPEPFLEWMSQREKIGKPIPMFYNHMSETSMPIGQWNEFTFTNEGLEAKGKLFLNSSCGKDIYSIMKESPNMMNMVSVGVWADEYVMTNEEGHILDDDDEDGYFMVKKGGIREASIVMEGNNPMSTIKCLEIIDSNGSINTRNLEKNLRAKGLSQNNAVIAVAQFKQAYERLKLNKPNTDHRDGENFGELLMALEARELAKELHKYTI